MNNRKNKIKRIYIEQNYDRFLKIDNLRVKSSTE